MTETAVIDEGDLRIIPELYRRHETSEVKIDGWTSEETAFAF